MIGVTIGIGNHFDKIASFAARCLMRYTGLDSVILDERQFDESGLLHPAALRFRIFDLVDERDVLYYDADWFCINAWTPHYFSCHENLIACHDFVLCEDWPWQRYNWNANEFAGDGDRFLNGFGGTFRADYIESIKCVANLRLDPSQWINTGFFIANRDRHKMLLERAEAIYKEDGGHHEKYYEQPAMLKAIDELQVNVSFLPRKYNVLAATAQRIWPDTVIGLHLKMSKRKEFGVLTEMIKENRIAPDEVRGMFLRGPS